MDTTQFLLTIVLTISTILLVIIGIQLIFVLGELRLIMKKINGIIESFEKLGASAEHGWSELTGFFAGIKTFFKIINLLHTKKNGKSKSS